MAVDPRYLDPAYWASLPIDPGAYPRYGDVTYAGGTSAFPSQFEDSQLENLLSIFNGQPRGLTGQLFTPFNADYITKFPHDIVTDPMFGLQPTLRELSGYFDFSANDPTFSKLSSGAQNYLSSIRYPFSEWTPDYIEPVRPDVSPEQIQSQFAPQDYSIIDQAIQPYRTANQLYMNELLSRTQRGDIKMKVSNTGGGIFGSIMKALPMVVGTMAGGPLGGALGGAISGSLAGGGLKGALTGAATGGIAGAGGLGSVLGKTGSALGGSTGGFMNTIGTGLRSLSQSSWNPFGYLGGGLQGLFGTNNFTSGLGSALSLGGPGALLGGALGGKQGALLGGLGGAGLGLGMDGYLGNLFGGGGGFGGGGLFGPSGAGGYGGGGGGAGGGYGGSGGILGGLFGNGGLGSLLAGGIPLGLLINEANKATDTPTSTRTPYSSVNDGFANLDPTIRARLLDTGEWLGGIGAGEMAMRPQSRNTVLESNQGFRDLLGQARGNQNAFIQARVNPLMAQAAQRRGEMERGLGLRGVGGSSFGDQALSRFDIDSQSAIGDASSQATQESLGMQQALNQLLQQGGMNLQQGDLASQNFQSQIAQLMQGNGMNLLQTELAGLGLGDANITNLLNKAKLRTEMFGRAGSQIGTFLGG